MIRDKEKKVQVQVCMTCPESFKRRWEDFVEDKCLNQSKFIYKLLRKHLDEHEEIHP